MFWTVFLRPRTVETLNNLQYLSLIAVFCFCPSVCLVDEFGAVGFSGQDLSLRGSVRGGPPYDQDQGLGPGPAPGIGFTPSPGSGASGPPTTNFNNIHIPPGAHAPANTPAELPPPTGENQNRDFLFDGICLANAKMVNMMYDIKSPSKKQSHLYV